jgi:hypothetical protein
MANFNTSTPYWTIKFMVVLLGIIGFFAYATYGITPNLYGMTDVPPAIYFAAILLALAGGAAAAESSSPNVDENQPIVMYVKTS